MVGGTKTPGWSISRMVTQRRFPSSRVGGVICPQICVTGGGIIMNWEKPSFMEVKMDAEISAYQDDFEDVPDVQEPPKVNEALVTGTPQ